MMNVRRREEKTKEFLFTEYNCCDGVNDLLSNSECLLQLLICKDGMDKGNQFQISQSWTQTGCKQKIVLFFPPKI